MSRYRLLAILCTLAIVGAGCEVASEPAPTATATMSLPDTPTPTDIPTWTPTSTPLPTVPPTETPIPTETATPLPTNTFVPSDTPTPTPETTPTVTPGPVRGSEEAAALATVHGVLFYSPSCIHCREVMTETLPPLRDEYGAQLRIVEIDITTSKGRAAFKSAVEALSIPIDAVPMLIVGDTILLGRDEISERLPGLIEAGLAKGGIDWPAIPAFVPPE
jgi:thiol-disulfide isomerase/thioredoxin